MCFCGSHYERNHFPNSSRRLTVTDMRARLSLLFDESEIYYFQCRKLNLTLLVGSP